MSSLNLFNYETCVVDEEKNKVLCLGYDGKFYEFPVPQAVSAAECNPCQLEALLAAVLRKGRV